MLPEVLAIIRRVGQNMIDNKSEKKNKSHSGQVKLVREDEFSSSLQCYHHNKLFLRQIENLLY